jgi:tetratricopeptide (TPR) repeat protein
VALKSDYRLAQENCDYCLKQLKSVGQLNQKGRYNEAIDRCNKALQLDPNDTSALKLKGSLLLLNGQHGEAIACYNKVLQTNPDDVSVLKCKGLALHKNAQPEVAIACCKKAIALGGNAWHDLACIYDCQGNAKEAEASFQTAFKVERTNSLCFEYGNFLCQHQRIPEAIPYLLQATEKSDHGSENGYFLVDKPTVSTDLQQEIDFFQPAPFSAPSELLAYYLLVKSYQHLKQPEQARTMLERLKTAVNKCGDIPLAYSLLGYAYQAFGKWKEAAESFKAAVALKSDYQLAQKNYAYCLQQLKSVGQLTTSLPTQATMTPGNLADQIDRLHLSLSIPYRELNLEQELGRGGFGIVIKGTWQRFTVAIKQLHLTNPSPAAKAEFEQEAITMAHLRAPNIVQLYGVCLDQVPYCIVMEYMPKGSLRDVLSSSQSLPWEQREQLALDIACGLAFLHGKNILHRDLKSLNVLLDNHDNRLRAKLSDFGLAQIKTETKLTSTQKSVGSLPWMAPELFGRRPVYSEKSDIYSYGMVLWEMASRKIPFQDAADVNLIPGWVKEGEREPIPADCPAKIAHLIRFCWEGDAAKRFTANQVVERLTKDSASVATTTVTATASLDYEGNFASQSSSRGKTGSHR